MSSQVCDDFVKPKADVALDILEENSPGSYDPDSLADVGPQVSGVIVTPSLSSMAKRLARIASSDEVNCASK
jgi:hypothetical protein